METAGHLQESASDNLSVERELVILYFWMKKISLKQMLESDALCENEKECVVLFYFYEKILKTLMERYSISEESIGLKINNLVQNYSHLKNRVTPIELEFNDLSMCFAYLHRYAVCHTIMVRKAMTRLFKKGPVEVKEVFSARKLDMVFLGSGPGNDAVGLLSVLYKYPDLHDLDITIVDKKIGWKRVFTQTVKRLRNGEYGKASQLFNNVNINTNFVQADLKTPSEEMKWKLERADVTFMVKVLSSIANSDKIGILKKIVRCIKPGSLLIFIDYPYPHEAFSSVADDLCEVYERQRKKFHLHIKRIKFGYENNTASTAVVKVFVKQ